MYRVSWWKDEKGRFLVFGLLFAFLGLALMAGVALAQDATATQPQPVADVTAPTAAPITSEAPPVLPTIEKPFPVDPFDGVGAVVSLIQAFKGAWYLGLALLLYLFVNVLRGKMKLGNWTVRIPWLSDWLDGTGRRFKAYIILGVSGIAGAFAGMAAAPDPWTAGGVAMAMFSGLLGGITLAFAAMGVNDFKQSGRAPEADVKSAVKRMNGDDKPMLDEETAKKLEEWIKDTRAKLGADKPK